MTKQLKYRVVYMDNYGRERVVRPVARFKDDGKVFFVIPVTRGLYDVDPPYNVLQLTQDVRIIRD